MLRRLLAKLGLGQGRSQNITLVDDKPGGNAGENQRPGAGRAGRLDPLFMPDVSSSKPAVVVVDMQKGWLCKDGTDELEKPDWQDLVDEVEWLVCNAVRAGWKVFVVEFKGFGSTLWQISRHLEDYPLAFKVEKDDRDGSAQLICKEYANGGTAAAASQYLICGVYAEQCVWATARGLAERRYGQVPVKVVASACRPCQEARFCWADLPIASYVQVV